MATADTGTESTGTARSGTAATGVTGVGATPAAVHVERFAEEGLGNSAYLVDLGDGRGLVVDPGRDVSAYLAAAERRSLEVAFSVETHLHADFVTGSRELAARGAGVLAPAAGGIQWPHRGLADGDEVELGGLVLRAVATPGHTPEHLSWLLLDGDRPVGLFSGGALMPGAVARTDLISPDQTEPLARALWHSLHERVLTLPDDVVVWPTHGVGSFCSVAPGGEVTTTVGRERATNPLLAAGDADTFVERLLAGYGPYPPYFLRLRERNRRGPSVVGSPPPPLPALDVSEVRSLVQQGAAVVDARPVAAWSAGHVPGSLSIALRPQFATWLGWILADDRPFVVVLGEGQDRAEVVRQALLVGYDGLAGELDGGVDAWRAAGLPLATTPLLDAASLDPASPDAASRDPGGGSGGGVHRPTVVDVREPSEFSAGHVPGAVPAPVGAVAAGAASLPTGPVATMCGHGERAATAASLLEAAGRGDVAVVTGGPSDWATASGEALSGR